MYSCKIININDDITFNVKAINYKDENAVLLLTFHFYEVTNPNMIKLGNLFDWNIGDEEVTIKEYIIVTEILTITDEQINNIFE
jgi:hypothetical protein